MSGENAYNNKEKQTNQGKTFILFAYLKLEELLAKCEILYKQPSTPNTNQLLFEPGFNDIWWNMRS